MSKTKKECEHKYAVEHPTLPNELAQCANIYCRMPFAKEHFFSEDVKKLGLKPEQVCNSCGKNQKVESINYCSFCEVPNAPYLQQPNKKDEKYLSTKRTVGRFRI